MLRTSLLTLLIFQFAYCYSQPDVHHATVDSTASVSPDPIRVSSGCHIRDSRDSEWQAVWRQFLSGGFETYRIARREDFLFAENKIDDIGLIVDLRDWQECPVVNGYFNGDRREDFAAFVVDSNQPVPQGLKFVILTLQFDDSNQTDVPGIDVHWVGTTIDLAKSYLSKSRGGLSLRTVEDKEAQLACSVTWDSRNERYYCIPR